MPVNIEYDASKMALSPNNSYEQYSPSGQQHMTPSPGPYSSASNTGEYISTLMY